MGNGKQFDVLVKRNKYTDERTGVEIPSSNLTVWADAGNKDIIKSIEGVTNVYCNVSPTQYDVFIDERYDVEFVGREIEAAILCKDEAK
jgi:hypothetical protein